jgi:myosin regulatory light chain 12
MMFGSKQRPQPLDWRVCLPAQVMSRYGNNLAPPSRPPSRQLHKASKARIRREPSGVFTLFQPPQVQQFKEAFSLIDQDGDGIVTEEDLKRIFASLGQYQPKCRLPFRPLDHFAHLLLNLIGINPTREKLDELLSSRPGGAVSSLNPNDKDQGVNFMEFLTMMGEHLFEFDTEAGLIEAFESFDEGDTGFVKCEEIRRWLSEVGERMDQEEVCWLFLCAIYSFRTANLNAFLSHCVGWLSSTDLPPAVLD